MERLNRFTSFIEEIYTKFYNSLILDFQKLTNFEKLLQIFLITRNLRILLKNHPMSKGHHEIVKNMILNIPKRASHIFL